MPFHKKSYVLKNEILYSHTTKLDIVWAELLDHKLIIEVPQESIGDISDVSKIHKRSLDYTSNIRIYIYYIDDGMVLFCALGSINNQQSANWLLNLARCDVFIWFCYSLFVCRMWISYPLYAMCMCGLFKCYLFPAPENIHLIT